MINPDARAESSRDDRILVLAPTGRDAALTVRFLTEADLTPVICENIRDFRRKMTDNPPGLIFLTEEVLTPDTLPAIAESLRNQPPWSDIPIIVLTSGGGENPAGSENLAALSEAGNVTFIERPVRLMTLLSALKSALRARHRQYDARDFLAAETGNKEALSQSEERLRLALDAAHLGAWQFNLQTGKLECTDRCGTHFGLPPDAEFSYKDFIESVYPEDRRKVNARIRKALVERREYRDEYRIVRRDGSLHWILVQGSAKYDESGKASEMVGVTLDITERKSADKVREELLESECRARAEAEAANRLKDEFLATVSHELRTPLNAILGWTNLLSSGRLGTEDAARALEIVQRNARNQAEIIEDLLDVSRILSGKLSLQIVNIDSSELIRTTIETLEPAADAKQISLRQTIETDVPVVSGDAGRLRQVVWNLLSNAVKFTPGGGSVEITARRAGDSSSSDLEIIVSDTGKGIGREFLPFVFDRFLQADGSTTRAHGGLGLGLAIVRHLVELHGGTVEAESRGEGAGATFTVRLPATRKPDENIEAALPADAPSNGGDTVNFHNRLKGLKILVVDDEADSLELIKTFLERCGAQVAAAGSMSEALGEMEKTVPDVLISDIGMPGKDGYQLIRQVRRFPVEHGGTVPAIALTAYARSEDKIRAIKSGFQEHLTKPIQFEKLVSTVANMAKSDSKP